ncbi:MAG: GNAT family N-acetyltransferase [Vicinamibacteria bacterium]
MILETARLRLRELAPTDLDFVAEMLAHPEVMRFYPKRYARDEAAEWLDRQRARYRRDGHGLWLVEDRAGLTPIGQIGLVLQTVGGEALPEIGYLVHRPYWRRGYASEAARGVRDHAFAAFRYPRVISLVRPENAPSQGVARTLGMRPTTQTMHGGFVHDVWSVARSAP